MGHPVLYFSSSLETTATLKYLESCPLCESGVLRPYALDTWEADRIHIAQARCERCHILVSQPQADAARLDNFYRQEFQHRKGLEPEQNFHSNREFYGGWDLPIARRLWGDWGPRPGARVLEVGCGYGGFLSALADDGGFLPVGVEMSPRCAAFCRAKGFSVVTATTPGLPFPRETFDAVFAMHVVEHTLNPSDFVWELAQVVRPGGAVILATEDVWCAQYGWDRLRARLLGRLPPFRTSSDHTFVFGAKHLELLLDRAGLAEIKTHTYHVVTNESLHWRAYKGFFRIVDRAVGHGDYLIAVGRRPLA